MSQDLLAEFGDYTLNDNKQSAQPGWRQASSVHQPAEKNAQPQTATLSGFLQNNDQDAWDDDDDFGDFEAPEQDTIPANVQQEPSKPERQPPKEEKVIAATPFTTSKARSARDLSNNHPFASNPDLLFDADDYDEFAEDGIEDGDDDDFGDFETTEVPAPSVKPSTRQPTALVYQQKAAVPKAQPATFDLLGLDSEDPPTTSSTPPVPSVSSVPPKKTTPALKTAPKRPIPAPRQESTFSNDDPWDDFETPQAPQSTQPPQPTQQPDEPTQIDLPTGLLGDLTTPPTNPGIAPSNIPPPSLLLTIFPPILTSLSTQFLHPLTTLSAPQKSSFLSTPTTTSFLKSYITLTHILAHIIAGRKSRWKRDKHLAQSMRIGPAMSGRSGGMKLTGLDRSEAGREDTEVEDVLRVWREQVGRLKSAVVAAGTAGLLVPELGHVLPVRVAKGSEGAIVSTQACALCGLKREERVAKVDAAVEDSFGEWWVEGTNMHTACLNFWDTFKGRLNSR